MSSWLKHVSVKISDRWEYVQSSGGAERVGDNVGFAGKINNFWPILFNNQLPAGDAVGCEVGEGEIFVVSVNNNLLAQKDGSVLTKRLDDCEKFELGDGVPGLAIGQLARVEGNWLVFLSDDGSDLIFGSVGVNFKHLGEVGVSQNNLAGEFTFEAVEGFLVFGFPFECLGCLFGEFREWCDKV